MACKDKAIKKKNLTDFLFRIALQASHTFYVKKQVQLCNCVI